MCFLCYFILVKYVKDGNYILEKEVYDWFLNNEYICRYKIELI